MYTLHKNHLLIHILSNYSNAIEKSHETTVLKRS